MVFISFVIYLSYFQVFKSHDIKNNSYNKRLWINEENVQRGAFLDRNGQILVYSEKEKETNERFYRYDSLYSHVIGYSLREYGKSGLELMFNNELLNISEHTALDEFKNLVLPTSVGNNLKLTIDHGLQEKTHSLLKDKKGAIIVMNPKNGEIYSMVSMPDFNVSNLDENWKWIAENEEKPFINRVTQGMYIPGSTFKIVSAVAALENLHLNLDYTCKGVTKIDGKDFLDYRGQVHGRISLKDALAKSCNTYFAEKAISLGQDKLGQVSERFMINQEIEFDLPVKKSSFPYKKAQGKTDLAAAAIGQGKVLVTPLNMAMITSAIANNGQMVRPILVKEVINRHDKVIERFETEIITQSISSSTANQVKEMMLEAVETGTGTNAKSKEFKIAGKTGTAENPSGKSHSWFTGFAPYEDPQFVVTVLIEEAGATGGQVAAPIAREILTYAYKNLDI